MLSFASATGNLYNRLGKAGLLVKQVASYQSSQTTNLTNTTTGVVAQLNTEPDIQAIAGQQYPGLMAGPENAGSLAQQLASAIANRMVYRDNPQQGQTLQSGNTVTNLREIIRQMKIAGASVLAMTITSTPQAWVGTGNGVINMSTRRPIDGVVLENTFAENMLTLCTSDSYNGGQQAGNESMSITGTGQVSDVFAFNWPGGSNGSANLSVINANVNVGQGTILTNGGFQTWVTTANVPDNWTLAVGVAGTNTLQESTIVYGTGSSLAIVGDGATLTSLYQQFNTSTGTTGVLSPLTQYGYCIQIRRDGVAAGAGTMVVELVDVGGNVINDMAGNPNSLTINLITLTTNFQAFTFAIRTPQIMPSQYFIRMRQTVALTNGRTIYLDQSSLGLMTQLYTGGPYASIHAGSIPFVSGDYAMIANTNSRGAGGTLSTFQTLLYQLYPDVGSNEIIFPSNSVPTISDGLIS